MTKFLNLTYNLLINLDRDKVFLNKNRMAGLNSQPSQPLRISGTTFKSTSRNTTSVIDTKISSGASPQCDFCYY